MGQCVTTLSPHNVDILQDHRYLDSPILCVCVCVCVLSQTCICEFLKNLYSLVPEEETTGEPESEVVGSTTTTVRTVAAGPEVSLFVQLSYQNK